MKRLDARTTRVCYKFVVAEALWQKVKADLLGQVQYSFFQRAERGKPVPWARIFTDKVSEIAKKLVKPAATSRLGDKYSTSCSALIARAGSPVLILGGRSFIG